MKVKRSVTSAYEKEGEDDTETYKIKMSKMQSRNCKTTEVYGGRYGKTEKPEGKGLSASLGLLHRISYTAYYLKIHSFQFPVIYVVSQKGC